MASSVKGQLYLRVLDASGEGKDKQQLWDANFVQGFVKVEIRGGSRTVKAQSTQKRVIDNSLHWDEDLTLNVLEDARELRLMLCRERKSASSGKVSAVVTAACGIYVKEILENVPIDKYFELFKPTTGAEGGNIHIHVDYLDSSGSARSNAENGGYAVAARHTDFNSEDVGSPHTPSAQQARARFAEQIEYAPGGDDEDAGQDRGGRRRGGGIVWKVLALALVAGAAFAAKGAINQR